MTRIDLEVQVTAFVVLASLARTTHSTFKSHNRLHKFNVDVPGVTKVYWSLVSKRVESGFG